MLVFCCCSSKLSFSTTLGGPVGWGCRIHWLHLCKEIRPSPMSILIMTLNCIWWWGSSSGAGSSNPSLLLLSDSLRLIVLVRVLSKGQIELSINFLYLKPFNFEQVELLVLNSNTWNHLTVCKQMSSGFLKKYYPQIICMKRIWLQITIKGCYAIKPNQTSLY